MPVSGCTGLFWEYKRPDVLLGIQHNVSFGDTNTFLYKEKGLFAGMPEWSNGLGLGPSRLVLSQVQISAPRFRYLLIRKILFPAILFNKLHII